MVQEQLVFEQQVLVSLSAETVEKIRMANSDNFSTVKINNLQATENRKMPRFRVFRQPRYISICFPIIGKVSI
jgi:hypothetical protein